MTPSRANRSSPKRVPWAHQLALWGPVVLAILLYLPSLTFDRTLDDRFHVVAPSDTPKQTLREVWQSPYWGEDVGAGLYRPVTSTTFWLEGKAHLPLPWRHAFNILLFGAVTFLLVQFAGGLGMKAWAAGATGVLFALHPVHVEAVAGLVGRAELISALALLLALGLHARHLRDPGRMSPGVLLASIALLAFLGAGAKESAWLLPLFALPLHAVHRKSFINGWPAWVGYGLGIGGHLLLRHHVLGGWLNRPGVVISPSDNPLVTLNGPERLIGGLRVVGENLLHLVVPLRLSPDYSGAHIRVTGSWTDGRLWLGFAFIVVTLALVWVGLRKRRSVPLVAGAWLLVSVLFFMNLFTDLGTILADRLLFWPSAGWVILVAGVPERRKSWSRARNVALLGLAMFYAWGSLSYVPVWRNEKTLFASAVGVVPESNRNWYNLGRALEDEGRLDEALNAIRRARTLDPKDVQSWSQEGEILIQQGKWEDAGAPIAVALRLKKNDLMSLTNEGVLWLHEAWGKQGSDAEVERAATRFRDVLGKDPGRIEALLNLALAEGRLGHVDSSVALWRAYIDKRPRDPQGLDNLAWLLATQTDRSQEAESVARQAIALSPSDPKLQLTLAQALFNQGKNIEAAAVARQALSLNPKPPVDMLLQRFLTGDPTASSP